MADRLTEDADFGKKKIILSNEAHFDLGGCVSKQNCRICGTENPDVYIEKPTHLKRVTVCDRLTEDVDLGKKNSSFQVKIILILAGCKQAKLLHLWHRKPARTH